MFLGATLKLVFGDEKGNFLAQSVKFKRTLKGKSIVLSKLFKYLQHNSYVNVFIFMRY